MNTMGKSAIATRGLAAAAVLSVLAFAGCGSIPGQTDGATQGNPGQNGSTIGKSEDTGSGSTTPTPDPVAFKPSVSDGSTGVTVDSIVSVASSNGTLSSVSLSSKQPVKGSKKTIKVDGALNSAKSGWKASEALDPGTSYTLTMTGTNPQGTTTTTKSTFKTEALTLDEQTYPSIFPNKGSEVGVGMPVVLTFDVPVKDKANFQKHLEINTMPKQTGTWHWYGDREVHFRPKTYWKAGTKVSVDANLNGVSAGNGIYGQNSVDTNFTIGRSQITKINLQSDHAAVYRDGKAVRTIPVSAGKPGWSTRSGIKLIMAKFPVVRMTNQMIGAKETYDLQVKWAMRLTTSGEFLHAAPWSMANMGVRNASHGCTGMSTSDAYWLYQHSMIGDPTETTGSSKGMEQGNGWADWNLSWKQYEKGSAL